MFEFAKGCAVTAEDFDQSDSVALIDGFIYSGSVTLIYSPPKQGKSWLAYGIAKRITQSEHIEQIYYLDMDNSFSTMKERGFDRHLFEIEGLVCMTKATIDVTPLQKLQEIVRYAKKDAFMGVLFVIDTIKDFIDFGSAGQAKAFMNLIVEIRDAGATVLVLHHSTKNEKGISGDQAFINSSDNIYSLRQTNRDGDKLYFALEVTHARGLVEDKNYSVDTQSLTLVEEIDVSVMLDEHESEFVHKAREVLRDTKEGLNKSKLLSKLGYRKDDKRHGSILEEHVGRFWSVKRERNIKIFRIKE